MQIHTYKLKKQNNEENKENHEFCTDLGKRNNGIPGKASWKGEQNQPKHHSELGRAALGCMDCVQGSTWDPSLG